MFSTAALHTRQVLHALRTDRVRCLWLLYALAALSFAATLRVPYIGEEGVYAISALEMWLRDDFLTATLYGGAYGRPPFYNWLVMPVAELIGWSNVLVAARLITACATVATGLVLAWLTWNLTRNRLLVALSAAIYLSGDVLFYRGWLAYSDPLFALMTFAAIACLWLHLAQNRPLLIWFAVAALTCAFLTKVQTCYLFYAVALVVLLRNREYRGRGMRLNFYAAHLAAIAAFLAWHHMATDGADLYDTSGRVGESLRFADLRGYAAQIATFPFEVFARWLPISALAAWAWYRQRRTPPAAHEPPFPASTIVWIVALNFLPYWFGPGTHVRYVMPLYPLAALLAAWLLMRNGERTVRTSMQILAFVVIAKYVAALWIFPAHQAKYRGDHNAVALQIEARTRNGTLYTNDDSSNGLAISARIDEHRFPGQFLERPPRAGFTDGYVLSYGPAEHLGKVAEVYPVGNGKIYLLCKGSACE